MEQLLTDNANALGLDMTTSIQEALLAYSAMVLETNKILNVTGARDLETFVARPLFDAMTVLPLIRPTDTLVDVGSGAGLPAVPICLFFSDIAVTMVEPRGKRADFLNRVVDAFSLNATVVRTQDREMERHRFQSAVAQAVFPPKKWIKRGKQLVQRDGCVYLLSSEAISLEEHMSNAVVEARRRVCRPVDKAVRWAFRLRFS